MRNRCCRAFASGVFIALLLSACDSAERQIVTFQEKAVSLGYRCVDSIPSIEGILVEITCTKATGDFTDELQLLFLNSKDAVKSQVSSFEEGRAAAFSIDRKWTVSGTDEVDVAQITEGAGSSTNAVP